MDVSNQPAASDTVVSGDPAEAREPAALSRGLGVGAIVFMVVAAAAPLGVVAATFPIVISEEQSVGAPLIFLLVTGLLLLFTVGYTLMSRFVPNAGAFYSYIQAGMGRIVGASSAMLAYVSYLVLLIGITAYLGVSTENAAKTYLNVDLPWWVWALVAFAVVAFLGYRNVELSARILGVALILEALVVIVMDVAIIANGGQAGLTATPLAPSNLLHGAPGLGFMFAFFCFFGFEATAVFRNEAKDPSRTIPRATYIAVVSIGVFYAISIWCVIVGLGTDHAVAVTTASPETSVLELAGRYVAPVAHDVMLVLLVTSQFACTLSFHNVVTRYQFTMGQKRLLPSWLGAVSPKHLTPSRSSLVLSAMSVVATLALALAGLDPIGQIYTWLSGTATLGIIAMMVLTGVAVILFFRRHPDLESSKWRTVVAPSLATIGLLLVLVLVVTNFGLLVGDDRIVSVIVMVGLVLTLVVGAAVALRMRARRPEVYAALQDR